MVIEEDRRSGHVVFRCRGGWEIREDELPTRVKELLGAGANSFVIDVSETPGADWLAGEVLSLAMNLRSTNARLMVVVSQDWQNLFDLAHVGDLLSLAVSEDDAIAALDETRESSPLELF